MLEEEIERIKKKLARDIRLCRKKIRITQEELARRMKVSQPFISKMEKGESLPERDTLKRLAKALELNEEHFLNSMTISKQDNTNELLNILHEIKQLFKGRYYKGLMTGTIKVKVYDGDFPIISGECFNGKNLQGEYWVPHDICNGAKYAILLKDAGMEPIILKGELVFVARQNFIERNGQLAIVKLKDRITTLRFVYLESERIGLGKSFKEATWYGREDVEILGVVVSKVSSYNVIRDLEENVMN